MSLEAYHFLKDESGRKCLLCPHECVIAEGETGRCGIRKVENGILYNTCFAEAAAEAYDPIEKKPLYHYKPSSVIFSYGNVGCNLSCSFCQNHSISQKPFAPTHSLSASSLVTKAGLNGSIGTAFTYAEPLVNYEFVFACSTILKEASLSSVIVTNGHINEKPLENLLPFVNAMNIDLKGDASFYKKFCGGSYDAVLNAIALSASKVHIEITTLIIEGENDKEEFIEKTALFLKEAGVKVWHLSRYFPNYKMLNKPTSEKRIDDLIKRASKEVDYVYGGNISLSQNTLCKSCGEVLVERKGYKTRLNIKDGKCGSCDALVKDFIF